LFSDYWIAYASGVTTVCFDVAPYRLAKSPSRLAFLPNKKLHQALQQIDQACSLPWG
jgi:hypothetical protein